MTLTAWGMLILWAAMVIAVATALYLVVFNTKKGRTVIAAIGAAIIIATYLGFRWYFTNTASGKRALIDQKSEFQNGIERTINVYTANGDIIATYTGKIDIADADGGYVKFDYNGKRYIYYNCFIETIADID